MIYRWELALDVIASQLLIIFVWVLPDALVLFRLTLECLPCSCFTSIISYMQHITRWYKRCFAECSAMLPATLPCCRVRKKTDNHLRRSFRSDQFSGLGLAPNFPAFPSCKMVKRIFGSSSHYFQMDRSILIFQKKKKIIVKKCGVPQNVLRICLYFCSLSPFPCYLSLLLFVMICNLGLQPSFPGIRGINEWMNECMPSDCWAALKRAAPREASTGCMWCLSNC